MASCLLLGPRLRFVGAVAAPMQWLGECALRPAFARGKPELAEEDGGYWWQILAGSARAWGCWAWQSRAGHMDFLCRTRFSLRFSHFIEGKTQRQGRAAPTPLGVLLGFDLDLSRWIVGPRFCIFVNLI